MSKGGGFEAGLQAQLFSQLHRWLHADLEGGAIDAPAFFSMKDTAHNGSADPFAMEFVLMSLVRRVGVSYAPTHLVCCLVSGD